MLNRKKIEAVCPVKDIMARYGDKWTMHSILLLGKHGTLRFSELKSSIEGISQRMLTVTLRTLQEDGLVKRTVYAERPPRVEYALTPLGESLLEQLVLLSEWAHAHLEEIQKARKQFARKEQQKTKN
ncbi:helix-turn-helix domain-containing protein [Flavihumibacter cheonanensis]|uniref:winged helix-turn-helix transcriptional regulator n=1 Tax=Flavihumibacter cheonanensis TaxID=1442385 RepID=UPI001EF77BD3|nr:helix-turn-helix domain-containing protein [Flavihumibacter cheonanensis]MCG7754155.1 helix-turn-helix transcriptional regulator [Flavihumibacter cheonanensis]